ncbi:retrovirus-related Pol polyprotein from transposon 17.6 [Trichonephila clavipes]|nr:retrovirus-related Pol polyprotein from transposon 17.6 [Trichonephila clavipes]
MHKKDLPAKIARWALMLEEFDYEVCHRSGRQMKHVDALSHYPIMMISSHDITQKIKEAQNKDEFISQLKSAIKITPSDEYFLKNEILFKLHKNSELLVVPEMMQREIVLHAHAQGHFASKNLNILFHNNFTFPDSRKLFRMQLQTASHASYPHVKLITTGVPRGNGQIERMHETIVPVLTKLTIEEPEKWFKHVHRLQRIMNSTTTCSTKFTPFEVLIGVKMKQKEDLKIKHLLVDELSEQFINKRETLRNEAKENILRLQDENKKQYNKHRKPAYNYKPGDTVAIQRTQFGTGLKL